MSFREKDFIKKLVESLGRTLAAALGLARQGKQEEALDLLERESGDLLGIPKSVLDGLDAASAARLLGDKRRIEAYAQIVRTEAEVRGSVALDERADQLEALAS